VGAWEAIGTNMGVIICKVGNDVITIKPSIKTGTVASNIINGTSVITGVW